MYFSFRLCLILLSRFRKYLQTFPGKAPLVRTVEISPVEAESEKIVRRVSQHIEPGDNIVSTVPILGRWLQIISLPTPEDGMPSSKTVFVAKFGSSRIINSNETSFLFFFLLSIQDEFLGSVRTKSWVFKNNFSGVAVSIRFYLLPNNGKTVCVVFSPCSWRH